MVRIQPNTSTATATGTHPDPSHRSHLRPTNPSPSPSTSPAPSPAPPTKPGARFLFMAEYTKALKGKAEATLSSGESFLGGLGAGLSSVLLTQPFDVVKTRLQAATVLQRYASTADCFRQIVRDEGVATLYSGTAARCARVVPGSGIIFMSADATYNMLVRRRAAADARAEGRESCANL